MDYELLLGRGINPAAAELFVDGELTMRMAMDTIAKLSAFSRKKEVTLHLSSSGGEYPAATALYDAIRLAPFEVTIVGWGELLSGGSIILQAGDVRVLAPSASVMIHDGNIKSDFGATANEAWADHYKRRRHEMYAIYAEGMNRNRPKGEFVTCEAIETMCLRETVYTAPQAVRAGLADGILGDPKWISCPKARTTRK